MGRGIFRRGDSRDGRQVLKGQMSGSLGLEPVNFVKPSTRG